MGVLQVVNDEQAVFKLNKNIGYQLNDDGSISLIDNNKNESKKLPIEGKDRNNEKIRYVYTEDNNQLVLNAVSENATSTRGARE
ncbi:hypothetical protein [Staphylococcus sp. 17KM0847]|uniref:hypothetical protein n=1 Tax=Staphylococcus sp. 17KM0847 TaxID=2583989 RepID=UPI0015DC9AC4|nr:hypothetical protein [Staphylococcus sp. 17KM0847]QLK85605.1 hypothetical protein FGL66_02215 [Staphylococcus sp. 17KM0847]